MLVARDKNGRNVGLALLGLAVRRHYKVLKVPTLLPGRKWRRRQGCRHDRFLNDILADRELARAVRRACLDHLLAAERIDGHRVDAFVWRGAEERKLEESLAGLGRPWRRLAEVSSAAVDLDAVRVSAVVFLAHLSANTRRQIRRSMVLYEQRGGLRIEAARDIGEALRFFRAAGEQHQAHWTTRGEPGAFAYPFYVRFHERVIETGLPAGVVEFVRVSAGEEPIGCLYNFLYRGRVCYYFSGFALRVRQPSEAGPSQPHALRRAALRARHGRLRLHGRGRPLQDQPRPARSADGRRRRRAATLPLRLEGLLRRAKGWLVKGRPSAPSRPIDPPAPPRRTGREGFRRAFDRAGTAALLVVLLR